MRQEREVWATVASMRSLRGVKGDSMVPDVGRWGCGEDFSLRRSRELRMRLGSMLLLRPQWGRVWRKLSSLYIFVVHRVSFDVRGAWYTLQRPIHALAFLSSTSHKIQNSIIRRSTKSTVQRLHTTVSYLR